MSIILSNVTMKQLIIYLVIYSSLQVSADMLKPNQPAVGVDRALQTGSPNLQRQITIRLERKINGNVKDKSHYIEYVNTLEVGSQNESFDVVFDTVAKEVFVIGHSAHKPAQLYDCNKSATCIDMGDTRHIKYKGMKMDAKLYRDDMTLISQVDDQIVQYPYRFNQKFMAAKKVNANDKQRTSVEAVFGLSPVATYKSKITNVLETIFGGLDRRHAKKFAFWFNTTAPANYAGELTIGGLNEARYAEDIMYHDIDSRNEWSLSVRSIKFAGEILDPCKRGCSAIIDSASNWIAAPKVALRQIKSKLGARLTRDGLVVDCKLMNEQSKALKLVLTGGLTVEMQASQYVMPFDQNGRKTCYLAIKEAGGSDWTLGNSFMAGYYTVFDYENKSIGFANLTSFN